jgi:hypothetical protein
MYLHVTIRTHNVCLNWSRRHHVVLVLIVQHCAHSLLLAINSLINIGMSMWNVLYQNVRYHCHTCAMVKSEGVCATCAIVCHTGHDLTYAKYGSFFCDCGARPQFCKVCEINKFEEIHEFEINKYTNVIEYSIRRYVCESQPVQKYNQINHRNRCHL